MESKAFIDCLDQRSDWVELWQDTVGHQNHQPIIGIGIAFDKAVAVVVVVVVVVVVAVVVVVVVVAVAAATGVFRTAHETGRCSGSPPIFLG